MGTNTTKKMVTVNIGGVLVVLEDEQRAMEAIQSIAVAFGFDGLISGADDHEPTGEVCGCGLKDYEHAWWAGWDMMDTKVAKNNRQRRLPIDEKGE